MAINFGGETAKGRVPAPPASAVKVLPHPPTPNFVYKHHPMRWQYIDETGEWLPLLGKLRLDPGVNAVDKGGDYDLAVLGAQREGWVIIPQDVLGESYVREYDVADGKLHHCSQWEELRWVGNKVLKSNVDAKGYREFLRELLRRKVIPPPLPEVLDALTDVARQKLERLVHDSHKPGKDERRKVAAAELEKMEAIVAGEQPPVKGLDEEPAKRGKGK